MPHWHPLIVHFPIALLTASVVVDLLALARRQMQWHRFAYGLLVAGLLTTSAAVITGTGDALPHRDGELAELIEQHEDLGSVVFLVFLATALGRLPLFLQRRGGRPLTMWILLGAGGCVLLMWTSHYGGELVYEHGVGVAGVGGPTVPEP